MTVSFRRTAGLGLLGLALCLAVPRGVVGQNADSTLLAMEGRGMSAEAAQALEARLQSAPDDVEARTKLLGYYFLRAHTSQEAKAARQQNVLWLIRNRPEAAILDTPFAQLNAILEGSAYDEGKKAWLEQVDRQPADAPILGRAANYLLLHDSETAESLLRRAEAAEPQSPDWPQRLGRLYALGLSRQAPDDMKRLAKSALDAYERSLSHMKADEARRELLPDAAMVALEADAVAKARAYAEEALSAAGSDGNLIHHGHLILGRIALRDGDVNGAKEHLLAAGRTAGAPNLDSFGPNMKLAKELLEKGERQAVLDYFKLCGSFWKNAKLEDWSKKVEAGRIPDFGANLDY